MEQLNHLIFLWINATPDSPKALIQLATFLANDLIMIVPLMIIGLWLCLTEQPPSEENVQKQPEYHPPFHG